MINVKKPMDTHRDPEKDKMFEEIRDLYKVPFACYGCGLLMENWDTKWFYKNGVCSKCSIEFIEDRDWPEDFRKDRNNVISHVKEALATKEKRQKDLENTK